MKRFDHLEFDDAARQPEVSSKGEAVRDTAYFHQKATQCFLHGDWEQALRNYSRALEVRSTFFEGWTGQIRMLVELAEYPESLVWADKALELFPEHSELLAYKALACLRDARLEEAKAFSDNSVSKDKIGPRIWLVRAEVLFESKSRVAEDCLSKALVLSGEQANLIRLETGRLLRRYQRYSAAIEHLQEAVRLYPRSALAWFELGTCQSRLGMPQGKVSLQQALHLRPRWRTAQNEFDQAGSSTIFKRILGQLRLR